jgi:formylglycine-generating enzyme required for sulfatase activity
LAPANDALLPAALNGAMENSDGNSSQRSTPESVRAPGQKEESKHFAYNVENAGACCACHVLNCHRIPEWSLPMLSHRVLVASCLLVAALIANPVWAQAPNPKDGPLGMKFVPLPKAMFYMGWDGTKGSAKKTEIKEDFEIAIHAVTQGQWQEVMGKNPSWFSRDGEGKDKVKDIKDEDLKHFPVETVSWTDAREFIKKLNEKEKGKGYQYRLPSEVEWEYACRGGATSEEECSYHFYFAKPTNDLSSNEANFNGDFPFGKADKGPVSWSSDQGGIVCAEQVGAV